MGRRDSVVQVRHRLASPPPRVWLPSLPPRITHLIFPSRRLLLTRICLHWLVSISQDRMLVVKGCEATQFLPSVPSLILTSPAGNQNTGRANTWITWDRFHWSRCFSKIDYLKESLLPLIPPPPWEGSYKNTTAVLLFLKSCLLHPFHSNNLTQYSSFPQFGILTPILLNLTIHPLFSLSPSLSSQCY